MATSKPQSSDPFAQEWTTPFGLPPFDAIRPATLPAAQSVREETPRSPVS